jgi:hypothetical protein
MHWFRFLAVVIGAGFVSSCTDWFFAGDWIHRRFTYPEVWRKESESRAIALSSPLPFLTCAAYALISTWLGVESIAKCAELALAIWILAPLPLILTLAAFIKLHRVFVLSYATGWLVKLLIAAVFTGWLLQ